MKIYDFGKGVPECFSADGGSLSVTDVMVKQGTGSLKWEFSHGDKLIIKADIGYKKLIPDGKDFRVYVFGVFLFGFGQDGTLHFGFMKDGTEQTGFDAELGFKNWRSVTACFDRDMQGEAVEGMDTLIITANSKGTLLFSELVTAGRVDQRHILKSYQAPFINNNEIPIIKNWEVAKEYSNAVPDEKTISLIKERALKYIASEFGKTVPSEFEELQKRADALEIRQTEYGITGKRVEWYNQRRIVDDTPLKDDPFISLRTVTNLMQDISVFYLKTKDKRASELYINILNYIIVQGFAEGSSFGTHKILDYGVRPFYTSAMAMHSVIEEYGITEEITNAMIWFLHIPQKGFAEGMEMRKASSDDFFNSARGMLYTILMLKDSVRQASLLKAYSKWVSQSLYVRDGLSGMFKEDGCIFHHHGHYICYAKGGLSGITPITYMLSDTDYEISDEAYNNLKNVIFALDFQCHGTYVPIVLSGRHPTDKEDLDPVIFKYFALSAIEKGDTESAGIYFSVKDKPEDEIDKKIFALANKDVNTSGNKSYPYACCSVHKRKDFMALAKGYSKYLWGSEIYKADNLYGRYRSYGVLEIINGKSPFSHDGYNWNRFPGATTINLPMGTASFTPLYTTPTTVSGDDAPSVSTQYISTLSKNGTMLAGDTVSVHYAYVNRGEVAEGATSYRWQTRKSLEDTPTILTSDSPANKTYTLTQDDFGKWIECVITPKSVSGTKGTAVIARNHYGNAFLAENASTYAGSGLRGKPSINAVKVMAYHENAYLYGSGSGEDKGVYSDAVSGATLESFTYAGGDAGRVTPFNAFFVKIGGVAFNDIEFFSKVNADDEWTKLDVTVSNTSMSASTSKLFELKDGAKLARYFRMKTRTASGYAELYGFFPCLTTDAGAYMEFPEDLRITKGDMSFNVNTAFTEAKNAVGSDASPIASGSVNVNEVGEYPVTYTIETLGDVWFPTYSVTKTFTVVDGIKQEGDEAFGSTASATNGSGAENLTDGNPNTSWTGEGTSASIVLNLGSQKAVSQIDINEDTSNITNITVYTSTNGTDWTLKAENVASSDGTVTIPATQASHIKLELTYSSAPTVNGIEVSADNLSKAQLAIAAISLPTQVSGDFAVSENGLYGTKISWLSNNSSVITADGSVTRQIADTIVTLTARIMDGDSVLASRSFHITVLKKEAQQSASKPSGSSGGSSFGVSGPAPAPTPVTPQTIPSYNYKNFADVPDTHWAASYVNALYEREIVSGKGNGNYEPEAQITRAEFLKLIVESFKLTADNAKADFADVSENDWFYNYVAVANALGIAKGTDAGFKPNEPILRRDMAVMAQRALAACSITLNKLTQLLKTLKMYM